MYRLILPDELIPEEINEKYTKILTDKRSFIYKPIDLLNEIRDNYINYEKYAKQVQPNLLMTKKDVWWQMIQLLPSSYNQTRNVMMNYEVLANIYKSRKDHKLDEWREFCKWIENLPYSEIITLKED